MTTLQLEIREAHQDELTTMLRVTNASYAEFRDGSPGAFWDTYMANIEETILRAPDTERIAALLDGELVASVLLCRRPLKGDDPEIRLLAVLPHLRTRGIARQLMDECELRVRRMGKTRVVLHTTRLMSIARHWYERSGYVRFEAIDFYPVPGFLVMGFAKDLSSGISSDSTARGRRGTELQHGDNSGYRGHRRHRSSDMRKAADGDSSAHFVYPMFGGMVEATAIFAQVAREQRFEMIANMSHEQARPYAGNMASAAHWLSEQIFNWSGVSVAHLRITFFAEWLRYIAPLIKAGRCVTPFDPDRFAPVPAADIARVVAGILEDPGPHIGQAY